MAVFQSGNATICSGLPCAFLHSYIDEEIIVFLRLSFSILAFSVSLFLIGLLLLFEKYHYFAQRQVLYLSFAALLSSVAHILGFQIFYGYDSGLCSWSGFLLHYTDAVLLTNILAITFNLILEIFHTTRSVRFEIILTSCSFGLPLFPTLYFLVHNYYGLSGAWCWIRSINESNCMRLPHGIKFQFFIWYGPLFAAITVLFGMQIILWCCSKWQNQGEDDPVVKQTRLQWRNLLLRLSFAYMIISFYPMLNRLFQNARNEGNFYLYVLHVVTEPLSGIVMAVIFSIDESTLQRFELQYISAKYFDKFDEIKVLREIISQMEQEKQEHQNLLVDKEIQAAISGSEVVEKINFKLNRDGSFDWHWEGGGRSLRFNHNNLPIRNQDVFSIQWLQKLLTLCKSIVRLLNVPLFLVSVALLVYSYTPISPAMEPCELSTKLVENERDLYFQLKSVSSFKQVALHIGLLSSELEDTERDNPSDTEYQKIRICSLLYQRFPKLSWCQIIRSLFFVRECRLGMEISRKRDIDVKSMLTYQEYCSNGRTDL